MFPTCSTSNKSKARAFHSSISLWGCRSGDTLLCSSVFDVWSLIILTFFPSPRPSYYICGKVKFGGGGWHGVIFFFDIVISYRRDLAFALRVDHSKPCSLLASPRSFALLIALDSTISFLSLIGMPQWAFPDLI